MAASKDQDALLTRAIDNADEKTLRQILKSMCQGSDECRKQAAERMLVSQKHELIELSDSSDDEAEKERRNKKQKTVEETQTLRYEKCQTCEEMYDVTLNNDEACQCHDGGLDVDPDVFPDDDQIQYGIGSPVDPYTDWRREEWPHGFIWDCCQEPCNGKPCLIQRHIPERKSSLSTWSSRAK